MIPYIKYGGILRKMICLLHCYFYASLRAAAEQNLEDEPARKVTGSEVIKGAYEVGVVATHTSSEVNKV